MVIIYLQYQNKKCKRLCTDYSHAQKEIDKRVAEKLHALINYLENASCLYDVACINKYHLHLLHGDHKGLFSVDIVSRDNPWRLILLPLDKSGNRWEIKDINGMYQATSAVLLLEVSKHYE